MINQPFENWWGCLRPQERNLISALIPFWFTNPTYIGRATFDGLAAVTGVGSSIKMLEYFVDHYSLAYELIPCGEDCFIDAVVWTDEFWSLMWAFSFTSDFLPPKKCPMWMLEP